MVSRAHRGVESCMECSITKKQFETSLCLLYVEHVEPLFNRRSSWNKLVSYCFMRLFCVLHMVFSDVVFGVIHIMFNIIEDFLFDSMFSCLGEFHLV